MKDWFKKWNEINIFILNSGDMFLRGYMQDLKPILERDTPKEFVELPSKLNTKGQCAKCHHMVNMLHHRHFCGNCGHRIGWDKRKGGIGYERHKHMG